MKFTVQYLGIEKPFIDLNIPIGYSDYLLTDFYGRICGERDLAD